MTPLEYAILSLTRKRQTERQIRKKLIGWGTKDEEMDLIIDRLKELKYLDDEAFSRDWIRYRSQSSPRGKVAIIRELAKKGVAKEIREEALQAFDEGESLHTLAAQKWPKIRDSDIYRRKQKLLRFLAGRGFTISDVISVVNRIVEEEEAC